MQWYFRAFSDFGLPGGFLTQREGDWAGTNPQEATWWHCLEVHDLQMSRLGWNLATGILQWFRIKWMYSTWILSGQTLFTKLKQDDFSVTPLLSHLFLVRARDVDVIHPNYIEMSQNYELGQFPTQHQPEFHKAFQGVHINPNSKGHPHYTPLFILPFQAPVPCVALLSKKDLDSIHLNFQKRNPQSIYFKSLFQGGCFKLTFSTYPP